MDNHKEEEGMDMNLNELVKQWIDGLKQLPGGRAPKRIVIPSEVLDVEEADSKANRRFKVDVHERGATLIMYQHGLDTIEVVGDNDAEK